MTQQRYVPSHRWVARSWGRFGGRVKDRLAEGMRAYGNRSFSRPPVELVGEIQEELLDVAAWAFILFERLKTAEHALRATQLGLRKEPTTAIDLPDSDPGNPTEDGLHLELAGFERTMLDALAARLGCSRGDVLRQGLHMLFRVEFADRFAADGGVPVVTNGHGQTSLPPGRKG